MAAAKLIELLLPIAGGASSSSDSSGVSGQCSDRNYYLIEFLPITRSSSNSSRVSRRWSELNYDLLVAVFTRLSWVDLIGGVSAVCSSWRGAARDPRFWRILDLSGWEKIRIPGTLYEVLISVLWFVRDCDVIEELYFPHCSNGHLLLLIFARLRYLSFIERIVHREMFCAALANLKSLKGLEVNASLFLFEPDELSRVLNLRFPELSELKVVSVGIFSA